MNIESVIDNIINLPSTYKYNGSSSFYTLLKDTGYFESVDQINEESILKQLIKYPEWIEQWLIWSDDKRTSSGWYFTHDSSGNYIVGFYPPTEKNEIKEFSNIRRACAVFIKKEIEENKKLH